MKKTNIFSTLFIDQRNYERPFFLFLTLVLNGMYIWAVTGSPELNSVWKVALFTVLMIIHITLYWFSPWVFRHLRWLVPYLIVQGLIAFTMGLQVRLTGFSFGLYPGLIGLVIGMPVKKIGRIVAIGFFLVLSLVNYIVVAGSGAALWWVLGMVPVVLFVIMYVSMYLRQAEAREQAQILLKDLETANRQLTEYANRVEDLTIAGERQRMARELHDTLSQGLAGLILQLEAVDAHLSGGRSERAKAIVQETMEQARSTLTDARRVIDDLRTTRTLELGEAARQEAGHFITATGIPCEVEISCPVSPSIAITEAGIRAITEGLTNIARHARATNTWLKISFLDERNELEIALRDDGVGFNPEEVEVGHYGLLGMRERVRLAGGRLEVHSEAGKGTQLVIRFPLENPLND